MTESKTPLTSSKVSEKNTQASVDKKTTKKSDIKKAPESSSQSKLSKLAIFALLIAIAAPSGHYYWRDLQDQKLSQTLTNKINSESSSTLRQYKNQLEQTLKKQEQVVAQQLQQMAEQIKNTSQAKITKLSNNVSRLEQQIKQRQPSDWLLHEAEYLIRIASRSLWLEHDTTAAIGLLQDANLRLTELNDPAFLPVREVIHQDIKSLENIPKLETDEVILSLMAMSKQVAQLPLAIEEIGKMGDKQADLNLSDDINDWQSNLAKTWQKFLNDFIRVRQRSGSIEPLMSPEQQANLKQNLSLKIQLALWAASERKGIVYQKALTDIQLWINEFFDMENAINQSFIKSVEQLKHRQMNFDYSTELNALKSIRAAIRSQKTMPVIKTGDAAIEVNSSAIEKTEKKIEGDSKTTKPTSVESSPVKSEDSI